MPRQDSASIVAANVKRLRLQRNWSQEVCAEKCDLHRTYIGAVERGGRVRATVAPDSQAGTVQGLVHEYVLPSSLIYTDDWSGYRTLGQKGYRHRRINHSARVYVNGDVHTQTIDGFFGLLKNGIRATHHGVSAKWLQGYCNEYAWRWNRRDNGRAMFLDLLAETAR